MRLAINFIVFQVAWLATVLGAANGLPWMGPLALLLALAVHLRFAEHAATEIALVAACGAVGAVFDSALVASGFVAYPSGMVAEGFAPYWIITMWMLFATTLNVSLRWLRGRPALAAALGLFAGPSAYFGGAKLGSIVLVDAYAALCTLAVGWAVMMPLLMMLAERFDGMEPRDGRVASEA